MSRQVRIRDAKPAKLCGYDYETTRIQKGTPRPLYITAFSSGRTAPPMHYAEVILTMQHLQTMLINNFLTEEMEGTKYIAWNGNNFDAYFTAAALVTCDDYVMRPYLTRSNALRGIRVIRRSQFEEKNPPCWEFLDGIAMLGLVGVNLAKFLETFAPNLPKMAGVIDFERETFNPKNKQHCDYAMRDSVGLEEGMHRAQLILLENFNQPLAVTMGGACIKILKANIPEEVYVNPNADALNDVVRQYAMRGGFCYCVRRYEGPVWKYDLNQAYAAAMRETALPCGRAFRTTDGVHKFARVYIAKVQAWNPRNEVPFYCRTLQGTRIRSIFAMTHIPETWLCGSEIAQLRAEGWRLEISESWCWGDEFTLKEYVDRLERGRMSCEGGPAGPEGTIYKNVGNHSYGKTLEEIEPVERVISSKCPPGYVPMYSDGDTDPLEHIYERHIDDQHPKDYHQPQLGAFITAHVRMVVRRAALLAPAQWLYADTDCAVFSRDVSAELDIDPKRYGAWKVEEAGTNFQIIAKKVYTNTVTGKGSAKGLHVKQVTPGQFTEWLNGTPPVQEQVQRNNFMKVMQGAEMYRSQLRTGTAVEKTV